jgi:hypothetical protein
VTDVTDNFNRADGSLGSNWVDSPSFTGLSVISNTAGTAASAWSMAYWNPATNTFANDQTASVKCGPQTGTNYMGPIVRHQPGVSSGYFVFRNPGSGPSGGPYLYRLDNGAFTLLSTPAVIVLVGDTLGLGIVGSVLTIYVNGSSAATFTDTTYTSGQPGIAAFAATLDDFLAGPIVSGTTVTGVGAAAGVGAVAGAGAGLAASVAAASGVAAVLGVGARTGIISAVATAHGAASVAGRSSSVISPRPGMGGGIVSTIIVPEESRILMVRAESRLIEVPGEWRSVHVLEEAYGQ